MAITRVHPAFDDFRFGELIQQLGGLWPPVSKRTVGPTLFPPAPHLRPTGGFRSRWSAGVLGAAPAPSLLSG